MSITSDIIRGHTEAIILSHLMEGDSYGYQINKDILEKTDSRYELKEATLYTAFRRLEQAGYITAYWGNQKTGARRRYYSITPEGRAAYCGYKRDWEEAKELIDKLLRQERQKMKERLRTFMDELLKDVPKSRKVLELKEELIGNMEERYEDLMGQGYREEDAYQCALDSAGDVRELFREFMEPLDTAERKEEDFTVRRKRSLLNAVSVSLYIVGFAVWMIIVAIGYGVSSTGEVDVVYGLTGFIVMLIFTAVATGMRVYCSGLYGKYQKYEKKDDTIVEEFKEWKSGTDRSREMRKAIDSVIWLLATILYFVISFGTMAWYITWVIWLIAPCAQTIVHLVMEQERK